MEYYHAFTKGLETDVLFRDNADFVYGMNLVPRCLKATGTKLLAFCLMDNHVHFVIGGPRDRCNLFIRNYKRDLLSFLNKNRKRNLSETMIPGIIKVDNINNLLTVIAYVLRNPIAAGVNYLPQDYRWSSASCCFRRHGLTNGPGRRKIADLSFTEKRSYFKRNPEYPSCWTVDEDGMILSENYVEVAEVEKLFSSVKRFLYYISAAKETEVNLTMRHSVWLSDAELIKEAVGICLEMFGTTSIKMLGYSQKIKVCKQLRSMFGTSFKQLGRVMRLEANNIKEML